MPRPFGGRTHLERTREASRAKQSFAAESEVVKKFETLASHVLPAGQVAELCDAVLELDQLNDAARLARLLAL